MSVTRVDISVNYVTKFFVIGENLLEDLSFEIQEGERVAILGRNGCGKTTLFNILTGQMDYDSGEVSDALFSEYGIATRPGAHCAPLMHEALGTVEQGAVRFSFSHYNTKEAIQIAVSALRELAQEE